MAPARLTHNATGDIIAGSIDYQTGVITGLTFASPVAIGNPCRVDWKLLRSARAPAAGQEDLEAANDAGIPVTVTNSDVNPEDQDLTAAYSGPDTYGQGVASAEIFCELAGDEEIGIIMVNGLTGNSTAIDREAGFEETINEQCPNVTILARQPGNWNKDESQIAASEMITAVGAENIGGAYAADDTMVAGVIDALKAQGIDPEPLIITSIGNTFLGNPLVVSGELDGTVFQSSSWDGENAAVVAHQILTDAPSDRFVAFMPSVKVTADNADDPAVAPEW